MQVTFLVGGRFLGWSPGQIVTTILTPQLRGILTEGKHATLIDPLTLEEPSGSSTSATDSEERPADVGSSGSNGTKSKSRQRPSRSEETSTPFRDWELNSISAVRQSSGLSEEDSSADHSGREADTDIF
jgi:hypothetical protein